MEYRIRDGIVMESVCGRELLIATLEAREYCPYLVELNEASAYIWKRLFSGTSPDKIASDIAADYGLSEKEASETVDAFLSELIKQQYLLPYTEEE